MITIPITIDQALELCRDPAAEVELVAEAPGIALTLYVATRLQRPIGDLPEGTDPPTLRPSGPDDDDQADGGNVCPHCGRTFASPNGLSIHLGRAHGTKPKPAAKTAPKTKSEPTAPTPPGGMFHCSDCELSFDSPQKRGAHRRFQHPNPLSVVPSTSEASVLADVPFERTPFDPQTIREQTAAAIR